MKCYYQHREEDGWIKGELVSMSGGKEINFHSRDEQDRVVHQITIWQPEILFFGSGFTVSGFIREKDKGDNIYKLITVDVVTGQTVHRHKGKVMVAVTIDLWPFGYAQEARSLVIIAIWNDGSGDRVEGNYKYRISHQLDTSYATEAAKKTKIEKPTALDLCDDVNEAWVWKSGKIEHFKRQKGAASLLAAVLKDAKL